MDGVLSYEIAVQCTGEELNVDAMDCFDSRFSFCGDKRGSVAELRLSEIVLTKKFNQPFKLVWIVGAQKKSFIE